MHRVVVASAPERGEPAQDGERFLWLGDGQSKVMTGEFGHDGEA